MVYAVSTLSDAISTIKSDIATRLSGGDAMPPRSVLGVLARAQAGAEDDLNGYISWLATQIPWDSADSDLLVRWASIWGLTRDAPTAAGGPVIFTGSGIVAAGTLVNRSDGLQYKVTADVKVNSSTTGTPGTVTCTSVGAATNTDAGTPLTLATSVNGVAATVTVGSAALSGGSDIETIASLKSRLLDRVQEPPMGGSKADFIRWAKSVPGVSRVWVLPGWLGAGTLGVTFMMDGLDDPIPTATAVGLVQAAIDAARPVAAATTVFAPTAIALNPVITLIPDSTTARTAVTAQLTTLITSAGTAIGGTLLLSQLRTAIGTATGVTDYAMTTPSANVTTAAGQIPVLGTISWGS